MEVTMFNKRETDIEEVKMNAYENVSREYESKPKTQNSNTILKGSKLLGDITIIQDLEVHGDVEGNITAVQKSNIFIRGNCKGNIETKEGSVEIEGEMSDGDIVAGGNVKLIGKFDGGKIEAKEKIFINGEFHGKLESNEIEIGSKAQGKGEIFYREYISIQKGAKVEAQISKRQEERKQEERKQEKKSVDSKVIALEFPNQEIKTDTV
jgi:cytoskeletal protein CcmA (bactofilin family)